MTTSIWKYSLTICLITFISIALANYSSQSEMSDNMETYQEVNHEGNPAFDKVMSVIMHKRCINCHPAGNKPLQGVDSHLHNFGIQRGTDGQGSLAHNCSTCHNKENNNYSGVPGAPHWSLAPKEMAWQGKSRIEIAHQIMDPARNGGKSPHEIMKHLTEDELVLWAWNPGINAEGDLREKPPVSKEDFITAVKKWIEDGAPIPTK